jgi:uncharacterized protein YqgC (DUF456 family)
MITIGLVGIVVPVLPGLVLIWGGVAVWAGARHDLAGWVTLTVATVIALGGLLIKYVLPGRRLRSAGVGWPTLASGAALGVVGFFVIPVVGLFVGFVLGIYLAERIRLGSPGTAPPGEGTATDPPTPPCEGTASGPPASPGPDPEIPAEAAPPVPTAWASTKAALVAVGWSIAIELVTGLLVTSAWLAALAAS